MTITWRYRHLITYDNINVYNSAPLRVLSLVCAMRQAYEHLYDIELQQATLNGAVEPATDE